MTDTPTAHAIVNALTSRGGFDQWWTCRDPESQKQILEIIERVIEQTGRLYT